MGHHSARELASQKQEPRRKVRSASRSFGALKRASRRGVLKRQGPFQAAFEEAADFLMASARRFLQVEVGHTLGPIAIAPGVTNLYARRHSGEEGRSTM